MNRGWGDWSQFFECSKLCGGGKQLRNRSCDNPRPSHGGADCSGNAEETRTCNTEPCRGISMLMSKGTLQIIILMKLTSYQLNVINCHIISVIGTDAMIDIVSVSIHKICKKNNKQFKLSNHIRA